MTTCPHCNVPTEPRNERGEYDDVFGVPTCAVCGWTEPDSDDSRVVSGNWSYRWVFNGDPSIASVNDQSVTLRVSHSHLRFNCRCELSPTPMIGMIGWLSASDLLNDEEVKQRIKDEWDRVFEKMMGRRFGE